MSVHVRTAPGAARDGHSSTGRACYSLPPPEVSSGEVFFSPPPQLGRRLFLQLRGEREERRERKKKKEKSWAEEEKLKEVSANGDIKDSEVEERPREEGGAGWGWISAPFEPSSPDM